MPLVIVCGYPSSGKSTLTQQLVETLKTSKPDGNVVVIRDEDFGSFSREMYNNSNEEKEARGWCRSEVQRHLSTDTVVILDALNYIKGYRYELFCIAKSCKTTYCVIQCRPTVETAVAFNNGRPESDRYQISTLTALTQRYEEPDAKNRWDSPLFTICPPGDQPPLEEICACVYGGKLLTPNQSTQTQPLASTNFLFELDKITQEVTASIMAEQKSAMLGDKICLAHTTEKLELKKIWTLGELTRIRRQFITYVKTHPVENKDQLVLMFLKFLQTHE